MAGAAMSEPRTIRAARLAVRDLETRLERIHMAPATSLADFSAGWYLKRARLALRQAERAMAKSDDPRLEPLAALRPQIRDRRPETSPRARRYRCTGCFREELLTSDMFERGPCHVRLVGPRGEREVITCGSWEPVRRLPARKAKGPL